VAAASSVSEEVEGFDQTKAAAVGFMSWSRENNAFACSLLGGTIGERMQVVCRTSVKRKNPTVTVWPGGKARDTRPGFE